jgi:hypothetical protein
MFKADSETTKFAKALGISKDQASGIREELFRIQDGQKFTYDEVSASFTEIKTYYDVDIRGNKTILNGGSFIHHYQSLRNPSKKRGWYLAKKVNGRITLQVC